MKQLTLERACASSERHRKATQERNFKLTAVYVRLRWQDRPLCLAGLSGQAATPNDRAAGAKRKFTSPSSGGPDAIIDRFSGLFAQFEADGMSGFPLPDGGAIDGRTMRGDIFDLQADHIAAA